MYEEIAKLIFDYSINNMFADNKFITTIISALIEQYHLDSYVNKIILVGQDNYTKKNNYLGEYNSYDKTISINLLKQWKYYTNVGFNSKLFYNIGIVLTIFHELDHVKLAKSVDKKEQSLDVFFEELLYSSINKLNEEVKKWENTSEEYEENLELITIREYNKHLLNGTLLFLKTFKEMFKQQKNKLVYKKYHDMEPAERRANIYSHVKLDKIFNLLYDTSLPNFELEGIRLLYIKEFINNCLEKYEITESGVTNSPSYDYYKLLNYEKKLFDLDIYNENKFLAYINAKKKYSFQERVLYGLPLNKNELEQINHLSNPFKIYRKKV